jgi:FkbM family methyltransferase
MTSRPGLLRRLASRAPRRSDALTRRLAKHFAHGGDPLVLTDRHGMRFVLHPWELDSLGELMSKAFYEPDFRAIGKFLKTGDVAFDVGANVGTHSLAMSRCVGPLGKVHAFEPVPDTAWLMRENLALNRVTNVDLSGTAISDAARTLEMKVYDQRYSAWNPFGGASFDGIEPVGTIDVQTESLDQVAQTRGVERIGFLKIDVEGYEIDALRGATGLLDTGLIDCLSFEISEIPLRASGNSAKEVFEFLTSMGYQSYKFDEDTDRFTGPFDDSDDFYVNFYASQRDLTKMPTS